MSKITGKSLRFFASCPKGVEDLLEQECRKVDLDAVRQVKGGVYFEGKLAHAYHLCLWSRVASRILLWLSGFSVTDYDDLYRHVRNIDWSEHMSRSGSLAIDCFSAHDEISNSHFATLKTKDAITDQFRELTGVRPDIVRDQPDIRINLYINKTTAIVYLDLSGGPLHKRGYRQQTVEAPLKENLAAAILLRCKWPKLAEQGSPFCDPMCGSGTLLIEAAYIAGNIAPGLLRSYYGFDNWKQHDADCWREIHQHAMDIADDKSQLPVIVGADRSARAIEAANENIRAANLSGCIDVYQQDVKVNIPGLDGSQGLLATNPPYGKRLGKSKQLTELYTELGQCFRNNYPGWSVAVFTSDNELAKSIGLRSHHKNTLFNGPLKCTLYQYSIREALADSGEKDNTDTDLHENALMFENRLKKNVRHISKWARKNDISCYRVYDADIPQYAFAVDVYDGWAHVQEYEPPKTVNTAIAKYRLNDAITIIIRILDIDESRIAVKTRRKQSGKSQYVRQSESQHEIVVKEAGFGFLVNLFDYLDTGLFLDHRNIRRLVLNNSRGKSFLNLFAYTGTATVYAAAGGARTTTTVDMSNTYLTWAQRNLDLNQLAGSKHEFVRADCLEWLDEAANARKKYELIFLDPPTFSNSKKMNRTLDINRDHAGLIDSCMRILADDGKLFFSCNARRFRLDKEALSAYTVVNITGLTTSEDFRRRPLHHCWCISWQPLGDQSGLQL